MKYLLIAFGICLMSCHDLHQKLYDTFHNKKASITKDSVARKDSISSSTIQLTADEEKDLPETGDKSVTTTWEDIDIHDVKGLKVFIKKLKLWSEQGNKDSIAANIDYPLINDENISSSKIFLQQYDKVFNNKVKQALQQQKLNELFKNFQGVMIGRGELWIANVSKTKSDVYKIRSINYNE
jgi:hypothetical protein